MLLGLILIPLLVSLLLFLTKTNLSAPWIALIVALIEFGVVGNLWAQNEKDKKSPEIAQQRQIAEKNYRDIFSKLDPNEISTGILADQILPEINWDKYDGKHPKNVMDKRTFHKLYQELQKAQVRQVLPNLDSIEQQQKASIQLHEQQQKGNPTKSDLVPFNLFVIPYNRIDSNVIKKGWLRMENGKLVKDASKIPYQPIETAPTPSKKGMGISVPNKRMPIIYADLTQVVGATLKDTIYNGNEVSYFFNFWYCNGCYTTFILVDFDDGKGFRVVSNGTYVNVQYLTTGTKEVRIQIRMKDGTQDLYFYSSTKIIVEALYTPEPTFTESVLTEIEDYNYPHAKPWWVQPGMLVYYPVRAEVYAYTVNPDGKLRNPVVVCDGFDPGNERRWKELYTLFNKQKLVERLKKNGYDVVFVNFSEGADYIERNAYLMQYIIRRINEGASDDPLRKITNNQLIVIGPSMGGLITRYALAWMEQQEIDHQTRLWISFDSPHNGANIALGFQALLKIISDQTGDEQAGKAYNDKLCSFAAQQMLVYHNNYANYWGVTEAPQRTAFKANLSAVGFPKKLRKIAIANGSGNGVWQQKANGTPLQPGEAIFKRYISPASLKYGLWGTLSVEAHSLQPGVNQNMAGFYARPDGLFGAGTIDSNAPMSGNVKAYDSAPGGNYDFLSQLGEGFESRGRITERIQNLSCFIPTISSLALQTDDLFYNVHANKAAALAISAFDEIYYSLDSNQLHVAVYTDTRNDVQNEIVPTQIVIDGNGTTLFKRKDPKNPNSLLLQMGKKSAYIQTKGELVAREKITFGPGFRASGANGGFHAYIKNYDTNDPSPPVASKAILSRKEPDKFESFISSFPQDMEEEVFPPFMVRYLQNPSIVQNDLMDNEYSGTKLNIAYPNPNTGAFKIALQAEWQTQKVVVSDLRGKIVYEIERPQSEIVFIDLPNVVKGLYQLSIFCNQGILTQKIIIQ